MEISGNSHRNFSLIEWKAPLVLVNSENVVPLVNANLRKFKLEFFIERKVPLILVCMAWCVLSYAVFTLKRLPRYKQLLTKSWYILHSVYTGSSKSVINHNLFELAPNSKSTHKTLAFKREAFYFLVLDQQTQESILQQLLLLRHLKRSRRRTNNEEQVS